MSYSEVLPPPQKDTHCQFATGKHFLHTALAAKRQDWRTECITKSITYIAFPVRWVIASPFALDREHDQHKNGYPNQLIPLKENGEIFRSTSYRSAPLPCSLPAAKTSSIPQLCRMAHHFCLAQPFSWGGPPFATVTVRLYSARTSYLFIAPILASIVASCSAQACSDPDCFLKVGKLH